MVLTYHPLLIGILSVSIVRPSQKTQLKQNRFLYSITPFLIFNCSFPSFFLSFNLIRKLSFEEEHSFCVRKERNDLDESQQHSSTQLAFTPSSCMLPIVTTTVSKLSDPPTRRANDSIANPACEVSAAIGPVPSCLSTRRADEKVDVGKNKCFTVSATRCC